MSRREAPTETSRDKARAVAESLLSELPGGGFVSELFSLVIAPAIEQRRDAWMEQVTNDLIEHVGRMEELEGTVRHNEALVDTFLSATRSALGTRSQEKLAALRSAVVAAATGDAPGPDRSDLMLSVVDRITGLHVRVLHLAALNGHANSEKKIEAAPQRRRSRAAVRTQLLQAVDELEKVDYETWLVAVNDLVTARALRGAAPPMEIRLSEFGESLWRFIDVERPASPGPTAHNKRL